MIVVFDYNDLCFLISVFKLSIRPMDVADSRLRPKTCFYILTHGQSNQRSHYPIRDVLALGRSKQG